MSKPIFIVRLPMSQFDEDGTLKAKDAMLSSSIASDYHVLVLRDTFCGEQVMFECFNAPHTEMEFQELQRRVLSLLEK